MGAIKWRRSPELVGLAYRFGNLNPALTGHFLFNQRVRENRAKIAGVSRLTVRGKDGGKGLVQIRSDVVPVSRYFAFGQNNFVVGQFWLPAIVLADWMAGCFRKVWLDGIPLVTFAKIFLSPTAGNRLVTHARDGHVHLKHTFATFAVSLEISSSSDAAGGVHGVHAVDAP